jgi:coenzyme F420-0:L-glutamate ligase/coenzyme F420-1:gamma-L-glutamate ligase
VDTLTLTPLQQIPLIRHGDNLADIVVNACLENRIVLEDNDILVFAQKIISKAEGCTVNLVTITPSVLQLNCGTTQKDAGLLN